MKHYPVIHPFLFAIYPILAVLAASLPLIHPTQAIRPLIVYLSISAITLFFYYWYLKIGIGLDLLLPCSFSCYFIKDTHISSRARSICLA
jgi:hypothetical protein